MLKTGPLKLFFADGDLICFDDSFDIFVFLYEFLILTSALRGRPCPYKFGHFFENFVGPGCTKRLPTLKPTGENVDIVMGEYHEFKYFLL